ncbi:MAG: HAD family hydrolase [Chloroflexi bacterium]|nr:HAD family hydrolase [Chloroflexota bacterium]
MKGEIRAVCFDIGDVMLPATRLRQAAVEAAAGELADAGRLGAPIELFMAAYAQADPRFEGLHINHLFSHPDIAAEAFRLAGAEASPEQIAAYLAAHRRHVLAGIQPDESLTNTLDYLKAKGYRLAVISNGTREHQRLTLERMGVAGYFEVISISEEVGIAKPARYLFTRTLEQLDTPPGAALMVGDDLVNDIAPAKLLGMRTALFLGHIPAPEGLDLFLPLIDAQVEDFAALARLL